MTQQFHSQVYIQEKCIQITCPQNAPKDMSKNVHCSIYHNSKKSEAVQLNQQQWLNKLCCILVLENYVAKNIKLQLHATA